MYNIYFNNRILTICSLEDSVLKDINAVLFHPEKNFNLSSIPKMMDKNEKFRHFVIPTDVKNIDSVYGQVFSKMTHVNAAGGLITNKKGEYLMILRNGAWDLPKGWQEKGEEIKKTAEREVYEETGLRAKGRKLLCITHHTYHLGKKFIIKHTYWYSMNYLGTTTPAPQTEEEITECKWVKTGSLKEHLEKSYLSISEVFRAALK